MPSVDHEVFMREALNMAYSAELENEVPVGAVVVKDNEIIGRGANGPIGHCDPTAHAEIIALRDAAKRVGNYRLPGASMYVTIEPCAMCIGAILHARIAEVVFGAAEPKAGMLKSNKQLINAECFNHKIVWQSGVLAEECSQVMSRFFAERRALKAQLKASTKF